MLTSQEINEQMWCKHTMEYDSAIEGNKPVIHATTKRNLEKSYVKNEKSQKQKIT